jgi:hypothetical protein
MGIGMKLGFPICLDVPSLHIVNLPLRPVYALKGIVERNARANRKIREYQNIHHCTFFFAACSSFAVLCSPECPCSRIQ